MSVARGMVAGVKGLGGKETMAVEKRLGDIIRVLCRGSEMPSWSSRSERAVERSSRREIDGESGTVREKPFMAPSQKRTPDAGWG